MSKSETRKNAEIQKRFKVVWMRAEALDYSNAPFPLTPALSPGERESGIQFLGKSERLDHATGLETIHPLPRGRGPG